MLTPAIMKRSKGKRLVPAVWLMNDHVIETIESIDSDQIMAVQWHPENMYKITLRCKIFSVTLLNVAKS